MLSFYKKIKIIRYTHSEGNYNCRMNPGQLFGTYLLICIFNIHEVFVARHCTRCLTKRERPLGGKENHLNEASIFL